MKSTCVIYALLGMTIGTLVLADNGAAQKSVVPPVELSKVTTTPVPSKINIAMPESTPQNTIMTTMPSTTTSSANTTTSAAATTTTATTPAATTTTTPTTTTAVPNNTTTITTPSTTPSTTASTPTSPSKTTPAPSTVIPSTAASKTTAVPSVSPSPSKDRQFDGLSFFGGIILTTCLMAIAAFSWKFYRQCKEGNYRTL